MAITKQDVWRVANEIDAAGDKPTAVEVRKRLGSGSYTTKAENGDKSRARSAGPVTNQPED